MKYLLMVVGCAFLMSTESNPIPVYWNDGFNDTSFGWWTGTGSDYTMSIDRGKYVITTTTKNVGRFSTIAPKFDLEKDFAIEARFVQKSGSTNNGFGLLWGGNGKGQHCEFIISTDSYFKIKTFEGAEQLNKWKACKVNPIGAENVLRVEAINSRMSYYLNGEKIADSDLLHMYGNRIGVINYTDMVLEVDNFLIAQDHGILLPPDLANGITKENLGSSVNSEYDEVGPHISADGRTLLFGVKNAPENMGGVKDNEDVWMSHTEDGRTWSPRENIGRDVNDEQTNNLASVSADNNMLLFCQPNGFQIKRKTNTGWSTSENISFNFLNEAGNMEGHLSPDGKAIIFSAKLKSSLYYRADSREKDLFVTTKQKNGLWSDPLNLGNKINSAEDEISPFLAADGRTLYYGSSGKPGYGSYDVFMAKRLGADWQNWSEPVNLGPEINGPGFDAYFTLSASGNYAYIVSNINSKGKGDLARVKLPPAIKPKPITLLQGRVLHAETKEPLSAEIVAENAESHVEISRSISDPSSGKYSVVLDEGKFAVHAQAKGYIEVTHNMELVGVSRYRELDKDFYLFPIKVGETIQLSHVLFKQGKAELMPESYSELDRLAEIMQESPTMKIELSGHTDNIGNKEMLIKLSQDRVQAVRNYLLGKGIKKDRIEGKGYGPNLPLVPNDTNENRERNRRVEFKILKK